MHGMTIGSVAVWNSAITVGVILLSIIGIVLSILTVFIKGQP